MILMANSCPSNVSDTNVFPCPRKFTNPSGFSSGLSQITCMTPDDIIHTLHLLDLLTKNAHGNYVIRYPKELIESYLEAVDAKGLMSVNPDKLRWTPLLFKNPVILDASLTAGTESAELRVEIGGGDESRGKKKT